MEKLTRLTPADRDNLVAYLDGELDEESSRRVESALAQSNVARTDVEQLARTYELLDLIDRPQASVEFTERTIASVKLEQFKPALSQQRWFQQVKRYGQRGLWTLAIVIAGAIGYSISHLAVPLTDDQIIEEFPDSPSWRFFRNDIGFVYPNNPWAGYMGGVNFIALNEDIAGFDFTGVKTGDLNGNAQP